MARTVFCWRAVHLSTEIERRFFDAESTDADASTDRGARKGSKTVAKVIAFAICLLSKIDASRFSGPEQIFAGAPYISLRKERLHRYHSSFVMIRCIFASYHLIIS